ncbi:thioredoxin domain-containing protein [Planctomycetia bacterium]|nr:thioredoxin domain-containing protein [Planctomycetia bacterium]
MLGSETSPYLLQHALNPVDWFPWGNEALSLAKQLGKPIFLSIGYSACHWCHVMEHESFENSDIAALMNDLFVCIKVDREERPDLDQIYMSAVQMMTGRGGWPMSVFLTPDLRPFFGGTYWPPTSRMGMPGFRDILVGVADAWKNRRDDVLRSAEELTGEVVRAASESLPRSGLSLATLRGAMGQFLQRVDWQQGGFGGAPKFPHPMDLRVLLRCWQRFGEQEALDAVRLTLDKMANGGIYDQLGGGFHRYSTDAQWLAPHFEKMLYDNALLVPVYLEAFQATGNPNDARVVRETLDYVLREMTQPQGGFYSTQDADSEGEEGKFFVWTEDEVLALLGPEDGRLFCYAYDVTPRGNWEEHNILNRPKPHEQAAKVLQVSPEDLETVLARCRAKLFDARSRRIAPGRDDKVLVSWNGLMIAAMSQAAAILGEPRYAKAASAAADFILASMRDADGRLLHSFKDGQARFNAYLDDYACLIDGLVDLYQATFEPRWLGIALDLAEQMLSRFEDPRGGFFYTSIDHEQLVARVKDTQDNATPSGNGMAAYALARLGTLTGRPQLLGRGYATLEAMSGQLDKFAMASGQSLLALDFVLGPTQEIVFSDSAKANDPADREVAVRELHQRFWPNKVVARRDGAIEDRDLAVSLQSLLSGKRATSETFEVFVCERGTCQNPVAGLECWRRTLAEKSPSK